MKMRLVLAILMVAVVVSDVALAAQKSTNSVRKQRRTFITMDVMLPHAVVGGRDRILIFHLPKGQNIAFLERRRPHLARMLQKYQATIQSYSPVGTTISYNLDDNKKTRQAAAIIETVKASLRPQLRGRTLIALEWLVPPPRF